MGGARGSEGGRSGGGGGGSMDVGMSVAPGTAVDSRCARRSLSPMTLRIVTSRSIVKCAEVISMIITKSFMPAPALTLVTVSSVRVTCSQIDGRWNALAKTL